MTVIDVPVNLSIDADGRDLTTNLLGSTSTVDYAQGIASCTLDYAEDPGSPPYNTEFTVTGGTGVNDGVRFQGLFKRKRFNLWPHTYSVLLRGKLSRAKEFQGLYGDPDIGVPGLPLPLLLGAPDIATPVGSWPTPPTDENIVSAALARVPGIDPADLDINGTSHFFGGLALADMTLRTYEDVLSYIFRLDEVCLGYRTYDLPSGRIYRGQIYGYPDTTSDYQQFTEGVDIFDMTGERSIENLYNAVLVHGWAGFQSSASAVAIRYFLQNANDYQPDSEPHVWTFNSPLIEQPLAGSPGYLSAQEVATWQMLLKNRELVEVTLTTWRDDLLAPGKTILVNAPHGGVTEPLWIRSVTTTIRSNPQSFVQQIQCIGGGLAGGAAQAVDYVQPPAA